MEEYDEELNLQGQLREIETDFTLSMRSYQDVYFHPLPREALRLFEAHRFALMQHERYENLTSDDVQELRQLSDIFAGQCEAQRIRSAEVITKQDEITLFLRRLYRTGLGAFVIMLLMAIVWLTGFYTGSAWIMWFIIACCLTYIVGGMHEAYRDDRERN